MNNKQPNFEQLKQCIYDHLTKGNNIYFSLLGEPFISMHSKKTEALKQVNKIIDNIDIRTIKNLIESNKIEAPKWFKNNQYYIDYNSNGFLDFIKIEKTCICG